MENGQQLVLGVSGLVEQVVSSRPRISGIALSTEELAGGRQQETGTRMACRRCQLSDRAWGPPMDIHSLDKCLLSVNHMPGIVLRAEIQW